MAEGRSEWHGTVDAFRRSWWLIVVLALAVGTAAVLLSASAPDSARASARLIVAPITSGGDAYSVSDSVRILTEPGVIGTLAEIVEAPTTLIDAGADNHVPPDELEDYTFEAEEVPGATVVLLHADGPDPQIAETLAAEGLTSSVNLFEELYPIFEVRVLDGVRLVDTEALSAWQFGVLGVLVGAGLGTLLVLGFGRRRQQNSQGSGPADQDRGESPPTVSGPDPQRVGGPR